MLDNLLGAWRRGASPAPAPPSGSAADALRRAFGAANRNDAAWISLGLGVVALVVRSAIWVGALGPEFIFLGLPPAVLALLLGLFGLRAAIDWRRGGAGLRPALVGSVLGLLLWFL